MRGVELWYICRNSFFLVFDPRTNSCVHEVEDHPGVKGSRVMWLNKKNLIFAVGKVKI